MSLLQRVRRALEPTFAVERELGAGGMGIVFEARDTRLERPVAVKVLRPESATAVAAHRFLREARLLARFKHPNVVQVHQAGESDGLYWFVMDLVQGETLAARLGRGALPEKDTLSLARELLSALAVAHEHGIVHRDIKPANIFLEKGHALLADFGIARTTTSESDGGLTATREMIGTPAYMSPEQVTGEEAGPAADQYSLALVLYECITGKRWPPLQTVGTGDLRTIPPSLGPGLRRALATNPSERWPDVRAFTAALGARKAPWGWLAGAAAGVAIATWSVATVLGRAGAEDHYSPGAAVPSDGPGQRMWNQANGLYRSGNWVEADSVYRLLLARDSSCTACEFRLLEVDRWLERRPDSTRIARVRSRLSRFSEPWSRLVVASLAPAHQRVERLEELTGDYRDWPLTWYYLGSELFNRGALFGRSRNDALSALEQITRLDSSFVPSWTDRTLALIAAGDSAAAAAALDRLRSLPRAAGLAQAQRLLAGLAFAFRFTSQGLELWNLERGRDPALLSGIPELAAGPRVLPGVGTPEGGVLLGRAFESTREGPLQRSGLIAQMLGNVALGRLDSARAAGRRLNANFPSQQHIGFAVMLDAAVVLLDDETGASDAARVEAALAPLTRAIMPPLVRRDAAWLSAVAALRRRDPAAARALLAMVADEAPPGYRTRFIVAAQLAASGQPDSALAITDPLVTDLEAWDRLERSPFFRAALRLSRARWFEAMGGSENARAEYRWHQHFHLPDYPLDHPVPADGDWAFGTLASWRQARSLDRGPPQNPPDVEVCASYRLVAERWSEGDARYRARADTARSRLIALKCEQPA